MADTKKRSVNNENNENNVKNVNDNNNKLSKKVEDFNDMFFTGISYMIGGIFTLMPFIIKYGKNRWLSLSVLSKYYDWFKFC